MVEWGEVNLKNVAAIFMGIALLVAMTSWAAPLSTGELHRCCLYPTVRVTTAEAGGSGTFLWSIPVEPGRFAHYVLTNHHVIESAIKISEEWDSLKKKEIKVERRQTVHVEFFQYRNLSEPVGTLKTAADIVAWDKDEDLALLKLRDEGQKPDVAKLIPQDRIGTLRLFQPIVAIGAGLGHAPFPTTGLITSMVDEIDRKPYMMGSAQIIFGNSGGGVYLLETGEFIGVPSRVAVSFRGFSAIVATHMGFFIPAQRIYGFLEAQGHAFLYDPAALSYEAWLKGKKARKGNQDD